MGTFSKLRDNSKKVIWAFLIVFILSMVAGGLLSGGFSIVPQIKALAGIDTAERNSLNIQGKLIRHGDYINIFSGFNSSNSLISTAPLFTYYRHTETLDELKRIKTIDDIYNDLFESDLSELDKLFFLAKNLNNQNLTSSHIYPLIYPYTNFGATPPVVHSINKVKGSIARTYFESFSESFEDELNEIYDIGEDYDDLNMNNQWDEGESFIDGNGRWDTGETFTDIGNKKWDEGEDFTDTNNNGAWDEGEDFTDQGNNSWDNGQDGWIEKSFSLGHIDYKSINSENQAQAINSYINNVASYDAKYEKLESAFNALNFISDLEIEQNNLLDSSDATIHYIEYDLKNISKKDIDNIVTDEKINSEIPEYEKLHSGISTYTLFIICLLLILFIYTNRFQRAKIAFGSVFFVLLFLIIIFKLIDENNQGTEQFKEIAYIYISKLNGEIYEDSTNGVYDVGIDQDCGLDGLCRGDANYIEPDTDNTENNNILDYEQFIDTNDNGMWDEGEDFTDANGNGIYDFEEKYADLPNGMWDEGEDFTDSNENNIWDNGITLTDNELNNLKKTIDEEGFQKIYDDYEGLKSDKIFISKTFNPESAILNQTTISSMIFDIINDSFESNVDDYFVMKNSDNNDNLNGYLIAYIKDEGNYYKKIQSITIEERLTQEAKKDLILKKDVFKQTIANTLGEENINIVDIFSDNEKLDQLENISDEGFKVVINHNLINGLNSIGNDNGAPIKGILLQMQPGEASDVIFSNNKAYLIFMVSKNEYTSKSNKNIQLNESDLAYTFLDYFNERKNSLKINDWRNKASRAIPDESGYTSNINDIYFNFGNFKAAFGFR